ncbi:hypothetical protein GGI43DRAFT_424529 [Trichoderma evansii]
MFYANLTLAWCHRSWSIPRQALIIATFPYIGQGGLEKQPKHMPDESHIRFEPGSQMQKLSEQVYGKLHKWHSQIIGPRKHIFGQAMWILLEYRQLRAGPMLIIKVMEELCNKHGIKRYSVKSGFKLINKISPKIKTENPAKESQELINLFQSEPIYLIVRPKKSGLSFSRPLPLLG